MKKIKVRLNPCIINSIILDPTQQNKDIISSNITLLLFLTKFYSFMKSSMTLPFFFLKVKYLFHCHPNCASCKIKCDSGKRPKQSPKVPKLP